jgi:metal-responsive CopG/Arc/MetJ family transcriptional regulator
MLVKPMPRRKLFEARVNLPLTADLLARIDAALQADEYRVDFIRDAVKVALEKREMAKWRAKKWRGKP